MNITRTKNKLHEIYLDWVNNWTSTGRMSEHYQITVERLHRIICTGRIIHESQTIKGIGWKYTPYPQPEPFKP